MMRAGVAALVMVASVLAACATERTPTYRELEGIGRDYERGGASPLADRDTCQLAAHRNLVGQTQAQAEAAGLPDGARVICLGCAYTEDLRPARLNLLLDADGKVASLRCG